jgi:hypothetical protein
MKKWVYIGLLGTLLSCGRPPAIERVLTGPPECFLLPADVRAPEVVTVGLFDAIEPAYAPWPHNGAEQVLFHHLYETLVTVDCNGDVRAGLADHWEFEHGGRRWLFELRGSARFWDGSRITADDVVRCWQDAMSLHTTIDSAVAVNEREVMVYVTPRRREVPRELSSPAFAVWKDSEDSTWPVGSGPYRIVHNRSDEVIAQPIGGDRPEIFFRTLSERDARDALDGNIDLLLTTDPQVIEYAASQPELTIEALTWDRTYVLLAPSRAMALRLGDSIPGLPRDVTDRLARDAVRGDAAGATGPAWWSDPSPCDDHAWQTASLPVFRRPRILYDETDRTARDLAERITALAVADPSMSMDAAAVANAVPSIVDPGLAAHGLPPHRFARQLRGGGDVAYVVALPKAPPAACYELARLLERVPWLGVEGLDLDVVLIPLVDTRRHVIARRGRFGLVTDTYGNLLIVNGK